MPPEAAHAVPNMHASTPTTVALTTTRAARAMAMALAGIKLRNKGTQSAPTHSHPRLSLCNAQQQAKREHTVSSQPTLLVRWFSRSTGRNGRHGINCVWFSKILSNHHARRAVSQFATRQTQNQPPAHKRVCTQAGCCTTYQLPSRCVSRSAEGTRRGFLAVSRAARSTLSSVSCLLWGLACASQKCWCGGLW